MPSFSRLSTVILGRTFGDSRVLYPSLAQSRQVVTEAFLIMPQR